MKLDLQFQCLLLRLNNFFLYSCSAPLDICLFYVYSKYFVASFVVSSSWSTLQFLVWKSFTQTIFTNRSSYISASSGSSSYSSLYLSTQLTCAFLMSDSLFIQIIIIILPPAALIIIIKLVLLILKDTHTPRGACWGRPSGNPRRPLCWWWRPGCWPQCPRWGSSWTGSGRRSRRGRPRRWRSPGWCFPRCTRWLTNNRRETWWVLNAWRRGGAEEMSRRPTCGALRPAVSDRASYLSLQPPPLRSAHSVTPGNSQERPQETAFGSLWQGENVMSTLNGRHDLIHGTKISMWGSLWWSCHRKLRLNTTVTGRGCSESADSMLMELWLSKTKEKQLKKQQHFFMWGKQSLTLSAVSYPKGVLPLSSRVWAARPWALVRSAQVLSTSSMDGSEFKMRESSTTQHMFPNTWILSWVRLFVMPLEKRASTSRITLTVHLFWTLYVKHLITITPKWLMMDKYAALCKCNCCIWHWNGYVKMQMSLFCCYGIYIYIHSVYILSGVVLFYFHKCYDLPVTIMHTTFHPFIFLLGAL